MSASRGHLPPVQARTVSAPRLGRGRPPGTGVRQGTTEALEGAIVLFPGVQGWGPDYDARKRTWYTAAMEAWTARRDLQTWTRPYEDSLGQGLVVTACHVVEGPDGAAGIAAVDISLQRLIDELEVLARQLAGFRRAVLVDEEGTLLVGTGPDPHPMLTPHPEATRLRRAPGSDGWFPSRAAGGPTRLLAWSRLPRLRWTLVVEVDEEALLAAHARDLGGF